MVDKRARMLFTSESVTEGHPDKICDQIADAILDDALAQDENSRVACEVAVKSGLVVVFGEMSTNGYVNIDRKVREVVREIGYSNEDLGFDTSCAVLTSIDEQSADIARGVDLEDDIGAGDQGLMFGYATNQTKELMPLPITLAHALTRQLALVRKNKKMGYLRPDGKAQVTVQYENGAPKAVTSIVVAAQHNENVDMEDLRRDVIKYVINECIDPSLINEQTKYFINQTGRFVIGGPKGDAGLTGRKIIADTYGGYCPHGGGSFSGKDATKVDRSAAYMARYICKNIVAAGLAEECEMQIAYSIGLSQPVSAYINTFSSGKLDDDEILRRVLKAVDLSPKAIINRLGLNRPCFAKTAKNGHFGNPEFAWEKLDLKL